MPKKVLRSSLSLEIRSIPRAAPLLGTISVKFFNRNEKHTSAYMIVTEKIFGDCSGLASRSRDVNWSSMFIKTVKSAYRICFPQSLQIV